MAVTRGERGGMKGSRPARAVTADRGHFFLGSRPGPDLAPVAATVDRRGMLFRAVSGPRLIAGYFSAELNNRLSPFGRKLKKKTDPTSITATAKPPTKPP